ncbi:hypothetical protein [Actinomadura rupiterrae]|uniref:hypothetical protein n=1 Tax=Actinomadura rupiterrae TaxID=559627 RepID=UPI0020A277A9|nr:hypothetical protein [Actinomadura rupiterrae]MCP2337643.1 hypothetical protein [Actinomadura rupiterrae]
MTTKLFRSERQRTRPKALLALSATAALVMTGGPALAGHLPEALALRAGHPEALVLRAGQPSGASGRTVGEARLAGSAQVPAAFRVFQTNMCMWGPDSSGPCFPKGSNAALAKTAEAKRASLVSQIEHWKPDAVTVNEGCSGDIAEVVRRLRKAGYDYTSVDQEAGAADSGHPRPCWSSSARGHSDNAIIARGLDASSRTGGYFEPVAKGSVFQHNRSWLCARVKGVRVCTAHLALADQDTNGKAPGGTLLQLRECAYVRDKLLAPYKAGATVFAGDTNISYRRAKAHCAPTGYWGLHDMETNGKYSGVSGLQHIYYSGGLTRANSCGEMHVVAHTDHKGFLLDLHPVKTPTRGASCTWRDIRRTP